MNRETIKFILILISIILILDGIGVLLIALDFKSLIFKRDLLWTAINAIKYSIELKQLYEAQRMLEETIFCGQLCNNITIKSTANCGCNK